jgi:hypothetical protein
VLRRRRRLRYPVLTTTALTRSFWPRAAKNGGHRWVAIDYRTPCRIFHVAAQTPVSRATTLSEHTSANNVRDRFTLQQSFPSRSLHAGCHTRTLGATRPRVARDPQRGGWEWISMGLPIRLSHCVLGWVQQLPSSRLGKYLCLYIISVLLCFIKI